MDSFCHTSAASLTILTNRLHTKWSWMWKNVFFSEFHPVFIKWICFCIGFTESEHAVSVGALSIPVGFCGFGGKCYMWEIILGSHFQRPLEWLISVTVWVGAAWPFVLYRAIVVVRGKPLQPLISACSLLRKNNNKLLAFCLYGTWLLCILISSLGTGAALTHRLKNTASVASGDGFDSRALFLFFLFFFLLLFWCSFF